MLFLVENNGYFLLKSTINDTPKGSFILGLSKAFSAINMPYKTLFKKPSSNMLWSEPLPSRLNKLGNLLLNHLTA
jgi:hypothetical protein